jgi:predicted nucleic acid-binding protein
MMPTVVASFIDSNVFIYAEANDLPEKQRRALALLRRLKLSGTVLFPRRYCRNIATSRCAN